MSASIFISYRRSDAAGHAGRLHDRLRQWFDTDVLFYDLDAIDSGDVFPQRLADGVAAAKVVLVLIGPDWLAELNRRAAQAETDFVRAEVEHTIQRHAAAGGPKVIPVLLGGAATPAASALDPSLRLAIAPLLALDMHAFQGKDADWQHQFVRLRELIAAVPGVPAPRYRLPTGVEQPFRVIDHSLSLHFSDPEHRLAALQDALEQSGTAAVVSPAAIYGMGGVGKTQLALKYSLDFRDRYAGVWWLRAETEGTLQLDALDACTAAGAPVGEGEAPAAALKRWLGQQGKGSPPWLLVFDNAEDPAALRAWLPDRGGHHVLITSRNPAWSGIAQLVETRTWSPEQGADFLRRRLPAGHPSADDRPALAELSATLGGLPLALEQAAAFLDETGMAVAAYAAQIRGFHSATQLLDEGRAATGYAYSASAALAITLPRLGEATAQLLRLLALCAPEPVAERLFLSHSADLPSELALAAQNSLGWERVIGQLRRYALVERVNVPLDGDPCPEGQQKEPALRVHRLTQAVVRDYFRRSLRGDADVLATLFHQDFAAEFWLYQHWPRFVGLAPHVLHLVQVHFEVLGDKLLMRSLFERVAGYVQHSPLPLGDCDRVLKQKLEANLECLGVAHAESVASLPLVANSSFAQAQPAEVPLWQAQSEGKPP